MMGAIAAMPRCPNRLPDGRVCNQKLGDLLDGLYINLACPRCRKPVTLDNRVKKWY